MDRDPERGSTDAVVVVVMDESEVWASGAVDASVLLLTDTTPCLLYPGLSARGPAHMLTTQGSATHIWRPQ
ncbi:hypothetical protein NUW54_g12511 [Trametes sanguinea]|uniref:Uncharacterized protein n=1 Tax=Trametes sanguinea TaxID=158606 RepID=A0ACC1MWL9_9APHY|nr:hypothetical protein NUW54_g12511 [Trametes sanguinea]